MPTPRQLAPLIVSLACLAAPRPSQAACIPGSSPDHCKNGHQLTHRLDLTVADSRAVANDGSPQYAYWGAVPDQGVYSSDFVFYFQGGGSCWTEDECLRRWHDDPDLMSSTGASASKMGKGVLNDDSARNPLWNLQHVYVAYDSSDGGIGYKEGDCDATDPLVGCDPATQALHFQGGRTAPAVLDRLEALCDDADYQEAGLRCPSQAGTIILSGASAGSRRAKRAATQVSHWLAARGSTTEVVLLTDAYFMPPVAGRSYIPELGGDCREDHTFGTPEWKRTNPSRADFLAYSECLYDMVDGYNDPTYQACLAAATTTEEADECWDWSVADYHLVADRWFAQISQLDSKAIVEETGAEPEHKTFLKQSDTSAVAYAYWNNYENGECGVDGGGQPLCDTLNLHRHQLRCELDAFKVEWGGSNGANTGYFAPFSTNHETIASSTWNNPAVQVGGYTAAQAFAGFLTGATVALWDDFAHGVDPLVGATCPAPSDW